MIVRQDRSAPPREMRNGPDARRKKDLRHRPDRPGITPNGGESVGVGGSQIHPHLRHGGPSVNRKYHQAPAQHGMVCRLWVATGDTRARRSALLAAVVSNRY
jgi:hypothetical protein